MRRKKKHNLIYQYVCTSQKTKSCAAIQASINFSVTCRCALYCKTAQHPIMVQNHFYKSLQTMNVESKIVPFLYIAYILANSDKDSASLG